MIIIFKFWDQLLFFIIKIEIINFDTCFNFMILTMMYKQNFCLSIFPDFLEILYIY